MTITIDWATRVINVPQADLTPVAGNIYELDVDAFRLTLKDLEDDEEGTPFPRTHNHNGEVSIGGVTYARLVEIINGYTVTFEDGQYAVNLVGANNNLQDVTNVNQVSVRPQNSAGLVSISEVSSRVLELWQLQGLDRDNPMTVTASQRTAATIDLAITGDGRTTSTVSRQ